MASTANSFFPGYYVGDPLPKPLKDKRKYGPPNEYKFDIFSEYLDWVGSDVTGLPTWVKDRIIGDWKSSLKADIEADTSIPVEVYEQYGEETQQDQPGAFGIDVSLNPVDWFTDPGKQLQKTASNWWEAARDWDDFDVRSKDKLWKSLLSGKPEGDSAWEKAVTGMAVGAMAKKTGGRGKGPADLAVLGKVMVEDKKRKDAYDPISNSISPSGVKKDAYGDTANAISEFQKFSAAAPLRDKKYDLVIFNSAQALIADIEHSKKTPLSWASAVTPDEKRRLVAFEALKAKVELAELMDKTDAILTGRPGNPGLSAQLSKYHQEFGNKREVKITDPITGIVTPRTVGDVSREAAEKKLDELQRHLWGVPAAGPVPAVKSVDERINEILGRVTNPEDRKRIEALANSYRGTIGKLQGKGALIRVGAPIPANALEARLLRRSLEVINKGSEIAGGDLIQHSAQRRILRELERDIWLDTSGLFDGAAANGWAMRRYIRRLSDERQYGSVVQFARDLEGGNLMKVYIWPRVRNLMDGFTPAYATKNFLTKTHFFGLVIDERVLDEGRSFRIFDAFVKSAPFLHKFSLEIKINIPSSANPLKLFATVTGGKHFEFVKAASKLRIPKDITRLDAFGKVLMAGDNVLLQESALLYLFSLKGANVDYAAFKAANLGKDIFKDREEYDKFFAQFKAFEKWLDTNKKLFKTKGATSADDPVFVLALFRSLNAYSMNKDTLDIIRNYAGVLEKVWSTLNRAQTFVFDRIGKFIAPISYLKTWITETLATGITEGITKALQAALVGTGIGAILAPLLEILKFALKFVIRKILDFAQAILIAILKMDFTGIYKSISKTFEALVKAALYFSIIPAVIFLVIFLMFDTITSSIPAFNPTFMQSGTPVYVRGGSLTLPPPDPNIECPVKDGIVSTGSYNAATQKGHGSNDYWGSYGCGYTIPYLMYTTSDACPSSGAAACSPMENANVCNRARILPNQPYYGFAADIEPTDKDFVYLSSLGGTVTSWVVSSSPIPISNGGWGYGIFFTSSDGTYKIYYGHLNDTGLPGLGQTIPAGNAFGSIADYVTFNPHTHIELLQRQTSGFYSGTYYPTKPETWFNCN